MNTKNAKALKPRSKPQQTRSLKRARQIMDVTASLLDRVGFDDLTTILITRELGISVGSLYHYFPNKHAILRSIAENWLKEWDRVLEEIALMPVEEMEFQQIIENLSDTFLMVYQQQRGILPLIQAIYAVPELRDLDEEHDKLVVKKMSVFFKRMGLKSSTQELQRLAFCYLEITHAMLMVILNQKKSQAIKTQQDLNNVILHLLIPYK